MTEEDPIHVVVTRDDVANLRLLSDYHTMLAMRFEEAGVPLGAMTWLPMAQSMTTEEREARWDAELERAGVRRHAWERDLNGDQHFYFWKYDDPA